MLLLIRKQSIDLCSQTFDWTAYGLVRHLFLPRTSYLDSFCEQYVSNRLCVPSEMQRYKAEQDTGVRTVCDIFKSLFKSCLCRSTIYDSENAYAL